MMRKITAICANNDWTLDVSFDDGAMRRFDVKPLLNYEAFVPLNKLSEFKALRNCGYFIEWDSNADLSADTLYLDGVSRTDARDVPTSQSTR